jgi:hypothetical protein
LGALKLGVRRGGEVEKTPALPGMHNEPRRRTKAMEIVGSEATTYRLLSYVALTVNFGWRKYALSTPHYLYTPKAA